MTEASVFDKLVTKLSSAERREMLRRIVSSVPVSDIAAPGAEAEPAVDLEDAYRRMGLLGRLVVVLTALFTGRDRMSVVESHLLKDLGRRAAARTADYDRLRDQLRATALESFRRLAASARHFADSLSRVMGRERAPFIAFLAGLHAPEVQHRLLSDADPFAIAERFPDLNDQEVKRRSLLAMEEALITLPGETRNTIYHDVRSLHHLMALASFPHERLLSEFTPVAGGEAVPVPLSRIGGELGKLAAILNGLYPGPTAVLLEALSLYQEEERLEEADERIEGLLKRDVTSGSSAYAEIAAFASRYPVGDLVRLAHANIHWRPVPIGGGEDWFALWKNFWQERIEKVHGRFSFERRMRAFVAEAHETLGLTTVQEFPGYPQSGLDGPARHGLSLGIVQSVLGHLYPGELQQPLTTLYRDGEFYKSDNRSEFDETMREIERVRVEVANLEVRLQPTGDLGTLWAQSVDGSMDGDAAAERQENLARQIDADASALVRRTVNTFRSIGNILEGVLYGTVGGRYDTINNLGHLGAPDPKAYAKRLEAAHVRSKAVAEILSELINLESMQPR